ncbi:hypothetical protein BJX70DRAFT_218951 [Aspergillus crustosus]
MRRILTARLVFFDSAATLLHISHRSWRSSDAATDASRPSSKSPGYHNLKRIKGSQGVKGRGSSQELELLHTDSVYILV